MSCLRGQHSPEPQRPPRLNVSAPSDPVMIERGEYVTEQRKMPVSKLSKFGEGAEVILRKPAFSELPKDRTNKPQKVYDEWTPFSSEAWKDVGMDLLEEEPLITQPTRDAVLASRGETKIKPDIKYSRVESAIKPDFNPSTGKSTIKSNVSPSRGENAMKPDFNSSRDAFYDSDQVLGLRGDSIKEFLSQHQAVFVIYYDPRDKKSQLCKNLYVQAASRDRRSVYAAVDCSQENKLCSGVFLYPLIKFFSRGSTVGTFGMKELLDNQLPVFSGFTPSLVEIQRPKRPCNTTFDTLVG